MLILSQYHIFDPQKINIYSVYCSIAEYGVGGVGWQ
jgi:hypothetical protein